MNDEAIESVRDRRACRTARFVVGSEHVVVDEKLRTTSKQISERRVPLIRLESIRLVDPYPRQFLPPPRQLIAAARQILFRVEQIEPRCEPLLARSGDVFLHR